MQKKIVKFSRYPLLYLLEENIQNITRLKKNFFYSDFLLSFTSSGDSSLIQVELIRELLRLTIRSTFSASGLDCKEKANYWKKSLPIYFIAPLNYVIGNHSVWKSFGKKSLNFVSITKYQFIFNFRPKNISIFTLNTP